MLINKINFDCKDINGINVAIIMVKWNGAQFRLRVCSLNPHGDLTK